MGVVSVSVSAWLPFIFPSLCCCVVVVVVDVAVVVTVLRLLLLMALGSQTGGEWVGFVAYW